MSTEPKVFSIAGRTVHLRQRCLGMTDIERRWRAQFLKDQVLSHDEPKFVADLYKDTTNIFRRLWKTPLYHFEKFCQPLGKERAYMLRHIVGKGGIFLAAVYITLYHLKYNSNNWVSRSSFDFWLIRERKYPDSPGYPNFPKLTTEELYDRGFYSSPYAIKIDAPPPPPPPAPRQRRRPKVEVICDPPEA